MASPSPAPILHCLGDGRARETPVPEDGAGGDPRPIVRTTDLTSPRQWTGPHLDHVRATSGILHRVQDDPLEYGQENIHLA